MNENFINNILQDASEDLRFQIAMDALLDSVQEIFLEQRLLEMENLYSAYSYCEE